MHHTSIAISKVTSFHGNASLQATAAEMHNLPLSRKEMTFLILHDSTLSHFANCGAINSQFVLVYRASCLQPSNEL